MASHEVALIWLKNIFGVVWGMPGSFQVDQLHEWAHWYDQGS